MEFLAAKILLLLFAATIVTAAEENEGFLNSTCTQSQDCYIFDNFEKGLQLACWQTVNKCRCYNTISSDYNLAWRDGKCRSSKYGPCGKNGTLEVDCLDGFKCIDEQCRDPKQPTVPVPSVPHVFNQTCYGAGSCQFAQDFELECRNTGTGTDTPDDYKCVCRKPYYAQGSVAKPPRKKTKRSANAYYLCSDIRSYAGNNFCSAGKFCPCGEKNGMEIGCHTSGTSCVNGTCLNPENPLSGLDEDCDIDERCTAGLICSEYQICVQK